MATYRTQDGTVVKTEDASAAWQGETRWHEKNCVSRSTDADWIHENLYRSSEGRYYIEQVFKWDNAPQAHWVTLQEANRWLLSRDWELPEDLKQYAEQVSE